MTLEERVAQLEAMLGTKFLGMSSDQLRAELKPENELPGGRYPWILSDYQIHARLDDLVPKVEGLLGPVDSIPDKQNPQ